MTSFAFNTMIGQVTPIALTNIGWKYYILFVVSTHNKTKLSVREIQTHSISR